MVLHIPQFCGCPSLSPPNPPSVLSHPGSFPLSAPKDPYLLPKVKETTTHGRGEGWLTRQALRLCHPCQRIQEPGMLLLTGPQRALFHRFADSVPRSSLHETTAGRLHREQRWHRLVDISASGEFQSICCGTHPTLENHSSK